MIADIQPEQLSDIIGSIYDSAVDPAHWPEALEGACGLIGATLGSIGLLDTQKRTIDLNMNWGGDPYWMRLLEEKYSAIMPLWEAGLTAPIGEPESTRMMVERLGMDEREVRSHPFFTEWAAFAGLFDVAATTVMRTGSRFAAFLLYTPPTRDVVGPRDLAAVKLLVPHIRRAVMISNLLDVRSIATATFEATLDTLVTAVVLVDSGAAIVHANRAAQALLGAGAPILVQRGMLSSHDPSATAALRDAIGRAAANESSLGFGGIGVPLRHRDDALLSAPSIAHVLPLTSGALRPDLSMGAAAAVFITPASENPPPPFEALAALYDLTPTEARVMVEIASGKNRAATARALGIADSTVKTHLARAFEKTGTTEQPELAKLVASLTAPALRRDGS
jgi:DNA-binding CsgD family transcriptional regulator/PAS domain-containing protein